MQELRKIWAFGLPYLKPYRFRFVLGIALSMFFGLSNGLFVLSVNALFNRLAPPAAVSAIQSKSTSAPTQTETPQGESFSKRIKAAVALKPIG